jgi:hypothetical protein
MADDLDLISTLNKNPTKKKMKIEDDDDVEQNSSEENFPNNRSS